MKKFMTVISASLGILSALSSCSQVAFSVSSSQADTSFSHSTNVRRSKNAKIAKDAGISALCFAGVGVGLLTLIYSNKKKESRSVEDAKPERKFLDLLKDFKYDSCGFVEDVVNAIIRIESLNTVADINKVFAQFLSDTCESFKIDMTKYQSIINLIYNYKSENQDDKGGISFKKYVQCLILKFSCHVFNNEVSHNLAIKKEERKTLKAFGKLHSLLCENGYEDTLKHINI